MGNTILIKLILVLINVINRVYNVSPDCIWQRRINNFALKDNFFLLFSIINMSL